MHEREVHELFHEGWPDDDFIKGFSVIIRPLVHIDLAALHNIMTTEELPGEDPYLARNNFDATGLRHLSDRTELNIIRNSLHCGAFGSPMHRTARQSLDVRLDLLLSRI